MTSIVVANLISWSDETLKGSSKGTEPQFLLFPQCLSVLYSGAQISSQVRMFVVTFTINESKFKCFTELLAIFVICSVRKPARFRHEKGLKRTGSSRLENKKPEFEF